MVVTRCMGTRLRVTTDLEKPCLPDGNYQQTKGQHSEQRVTTGKIRGFRKFDKVRYQGKEYFIKGRMSTGYAILMDQDFNKVDLKPIPKCEQITRVSARASWNMSQRPMPNTFSSTT